MFYTDDDIKKAPFVDVRHTKEKKPFRKGGFFCVSQSSISNVTRDVGNIELLLATPTKKKNVYTNAAEPKKKKRR